MTKWAKILKDHTVTNKRTTSGKPTSETDFVASDEPVPVTNAQLEQLLEANAAEEVEAPSDKGTDKSGKVVDRKPDAGAADAPAADTKTKA